MRLWLDDVRPMPYDYDIHVKSAWVAIQILKTGLITHISLDHDLGDIYNDGLPSGTGYHVATWIESNAFEGTFGRITWAVHSANTVGVEKMTRALTQADKFWNGRKL